MISTKRFARSLVWVALLTLVAAGCGSGSGAAPSGAGAPPSSSPSSSPSPASSTHHASSSASAKTLTPFKVALDWTGEEPQEMGIWIALAKGWFKDAGLDVQVEPFHSSGLAVQQLGGGNVNAAIAASSAVVLAVAKGEPIKTVAVETQKDTTGWRFFADSGIKGPKDFMGKKLGLVPGSIQALVWPEYAKAAGIDRSKVTVVNVTARTANQALANGLVEVVNGSVASTGNLNLEQKTHRKLVNILIADYLPLVGYGLALRNDELSSPSSKAFVAAVVRAWAQMYSNPKATLAFGAAQIRKHVADASSTAVLVRTAQQFLPLMRSPATKGHPFGWAPSSLWQATLKSLNVSARLKVSDVYDPSLLPTRSGG